MKPPELRAPLLESDLLEVGPRDSGTPPRRILRDRLLASISRGRRFEGFVDRLAALLDLAPDAVRALVRQVDDTSGGRWVDDAGGGPRRDGVRLLHFDGGPRVARADCGLVHVEPGVRYPMHRHRGDEWAFVLAGRAEEDGGLLWAPGDLLRNPAGSAHSFRSLGPGPFVFAVVLYDGLDFRPASEEVEGAPGD